MSSITNCLAPRQQILLSFDDGPDVCTQSFADSMDRYGIHGLFFVNGLKVYRGTTFAYLLQSMYASGHVFGTHTYSHPELTGLNDFNIRREMFDNELDVFRKLFDVRPYFVRSPYFSYDDRVSAIYSEFGYLEVDASFESTDWFSPENSSRVIDTFKAQIDTGNSFISLIHDHIQSNCDVLDQIIPYAYANGYSFVDAQTCVGTPQSYQPDNTYGPYLSNGVNA